MISGIQLPKMFKSTARILNPSRPKAYFLVTGPLYWLTRFYAIQAGDSATHFLPLTNQNARVSVFCFWIFIPIFKKILPWGDVLSHADHLVLSRFPQLAHPLHTKNDSLLQSHPPNYATAELLLISIMQDPSSTLATSTYQTHFEPQKRRPSGSWGMAYLSGHLALPALAEMQQRVAYANAFSCRRYPSRMVRRRLHFLWTDMAYGSFACGSGAEIAIARAAGHGPSSCAGFCGGKGRI